MTLATRKLLAIVAACALCAGLCSCQVESIEDVLPHVGQQEEADPETLGIPTYDVDSFELDGWEVQIRKVEIVFDSHAGKDDLIVHMKVKNATPDAGAFVGVANIYAYQGEQALRQANAVKDDGEFYLDLDPFSEQLEAGKSADVMYGWQLENYDTVDVIFTGFYGGVERTTVHFDVSTCQSEGAAAVEAGQAQQLDAKHMAKSAVLEGATVAVVDPWFLDSADETHAELRQDESPAQLSVVTSDEFESAEAWANRIHDNYTSAGDVTTVKVAGLTCYCFYPIEGQFQLFADCPDKVHAVNIYGLFASVEEATPLIQAITWDQPDPDLEEDEDSDDSGDEADDEAEGNAEYAEDAVYYEDVYYDDTYYYDESAYY